MNVGYLLENQTVMVYIEGDFEGETFRFHKKMFLEFKGDIPDGLIVRHKCDNRKCCNPERLELGTRKDNRRDFMERHPKAKEILIEGAKRAGKGTQKFWDRMTTEERDAFIRRRFKIQHGYEMHDRSYI